MSAMKASSDPVHQGKKYRATVVLSFLERQFANNKDITDRLAAAGFSNVIVTGDGGERHAEGLWAGPDITGPLDPHLSHIEEMPA
jgi:hypothetical protein